MANISGLMQVTGPLDVDWEKRKNKLLERLKGTPHSRIIKKLFQQHLVESIDYPDGDKNKFKIGYKDIESHINSTEIRNIVCQKHRCQLYYDDEMKTHYWEFELN